MGLYDDPTLPPLRSPQAREERAAIRPFAIIAVVLSLVAAVVIFAGCTPRYLTAEQEEQIRKQCEPAGCRIIPLPLWRDIIETIRGMQPPPPP